MTRTRVLAIIFLIGAVYCAAWSLHARTWAFAIPSAVAVFWSVFMWRSKSAY